MSTPLWRWSELCEALGLSAEAGPDITGISIDSRTIESGDLFIALTGDPGPRFNPSQRSDRDGHDFVAMALERGAAGVLTHDPIHRNAPELKVADTLDGLWALGRAGRDRLDCPVVAVTGSSGKTTSKTFLAAALDAFATTGSLNNHLGVPLSLARTPRASSAAVFEVGTNHPGEIGPLSELVKPTVSVLLNVQQAHIENFPDWDALRREKLSIINGLKHEGDFIVEDLVPLDDLPESLRLTTFGESSSADVQLLGVSGTQARYQLGEATLLAEVPGGGVHRARSLAAVLAVLQVLDRDISAGLTLPQTLVPEGRGNRIAAGDITIIDDSYNANPDSMRAALTSLRTESGRTIALLGEMHELGDVSEAAHAGLADACAGLEHVFCVGQAMAPLVRNLGEQASAFSEAGPELLEALKTTLVPGDVLLVKGSNGVFWSKRFVAEIAHAFTS